MSNYHAFPLFEVGFYGHDSEPVFTPQPLVASGKILNSEIFIVVDTALKVIGREDVFEQQFY